MNVPTSKRVGILAPEPNCMDEMWSPQMKSETSSPGFQPWIPPTWFSGQTPEDHGLANNTARHWYRHQRLEAHSLKCIETKRTNMCKPTGLKIHFAGDLSLFGSNHLISLCDYVWISCSHSALRSSSTFNSGDSNRGKGNIELIASHALCAICSRPKHIGFTCPNTSSNIKLSHSEWRNITKYLHAPWCYVTSLQRTLFTIRTPAPASATQFSEAALRFMKDLHMHPHAINSMVIYTHVLHVFWTLFTS